MGSVDETSEQNLARAIAQLAGDPGARAEMSRRAHALVDGQGAGRVARALVDLCHRYHSAHRDGSAAWPEQARTP